MIHWQDVLTILIPLIGILGFVYIRIEKRFEKIDGRFEKIDTEFKEVRKDIQEVRKDIQSLESRVARIEGQLTGFYYWEPKIKEKTSNG